MWRQNSSKQLTNAGNTTALLDTELLLGNILNKDRSWLAAHEDFLLPNDVLITINSLLNRRLEHEPIAYILGRQEFYGRMFRVDKTVLVPRPESESIIELFKMLKLPQKALIADVGCGSGALGITATLERPGNRIFFLDIDEKVFQVAKDNAQTHKLQGPHFYKGDLLEAKAERYDVLLCNLPYVPLGYPVNDAAQFEPAHALYSGEDGLDHFRKLFKQLATGLFGTPTILSESLPAQHAALEALAKAHKYKLHTTDGFAQLLIYKG